MHLQKQRIGRKESEHSRHCGIYCGIKTREFLDELLTFLIRCEGMALIVAAVESEDKKENLADLNNLVRIKNLFLFPLNYF